MAKITAQPSGQALWIDRCLVDGTRSAPCLPDSQHVQWEPAAWSGRSDLVLAGVRALQSCVDDRRELGTDRPVDILRTDVVQVLRSSTSAGFAAAMIWGFGTTSYGPHRLAAMLAQPVSGAREQPLMAIEDMVAAAQSPDPAAAFSSMWRLRRSRVYGLGTAFGTKLLYFASRASDERRSSPRPLVLDQFVRRGAESLVAAGALPAEATTGDAPLVPDPRRYMTGADYARYCNWAAAEAGGIDDADLVELALFRVGKGWVPLD